MFLMNNLFFLPIPQVFGYLFETMIDIVRDGWLDNLSTGKTIANERRQGWQQPRVKVVLVFCHHSITIAALYQGCPKRAR